MKKNLSLSAFKEQHPEMYEELATSIRAEENENLQADFDAKLESAKSNLQNNSGSELLAAQRENKILKACIQAGAVDQAEDLIASESSVEDCYLRLLSSKREAAQPDSGDSAGKNFLKGVFTRTAPPPAGKGSEDGSEPKNQTEAKAKILAANPGMKNAEAVRLARRAYPNLYLQK